MVVDRFRINFKLTLISVLIKTNLMIRTRHSLVTFRATSVDRSLAYIFANVDFVLETSFLFFQVSRDFQIPCRTLCGKFIGNSSCLKLKYCVKILFRKRVNSFNVNVCNESHAFTEKRMLHLT